MVNLFTIWRVCQAVSNGCSKAYLSRAVFCLLLLLNISWLSVVQNIHTNNPVTFFLLSMIAGNKWQIYKGNLNKCSLIFELSIFLNYLLYSFKCFSRSTGEIFVFQYYLADTYIDLAFSSICRFKCCRINCVIREKNTEVTELWRVSLKQQKIAA